MNLCAVCLEEITTPTVRMEGVERDEAAGGGYVWGPVPVHEACRVHVRTPYDDRLGAGFVSTYDFVENVH